MRVLGQCRGGGQWAHHMSSSDSGFPACPTEHCCYPKFVQRIELNHMAYIITAFVQFRCPRISGKELLSCKIGRERERER